MRWSSSSGNALMVVIPLVAGIVVEFACATPTVPVRDRVRGDAVPQQGQGPPMASNEPNAVKNQDTEGELVARMFLTGARRPGDVIEATSSYSWLKSGRIFWVSDWALDRVFVVATLGGGAPLVRLSGNPAGISNFLSKQFDGRFPGGGQREHIARLLKDVSIGPSAVIASAAFLENQRRSGLHEWLKGREKDSAVFVRLCVGIQGREDKNEWELQFNVFNTRGGVNLVKASGTVSPLSIREIIVGVVKAPGEFSYPLEG
jgi:hypothetical protein